MANIKERINSRVELSTRHDKINSEVLRKAKGSPDEPANVRRLKFHEPMTCHLVFLNGTHVGYVFGCREFMSFSRKLHYIWSDVEWNVVDGRRYETMRAAAVECMHRSGLGRELLSLRRVNHATINQA
jgi:hypothetical protein